MTTSDTTPNEIELKILGLAVDNIQILKRGNDVELRIGHKGKPLKVLDITPADLDAMVEKGLMVKGEILEGNARRYLVTKAGFNKANRSLKQK